MSTFRTFKKLLVFVFICLIANVKCELTPDKLILAGDLVLRSLKESSSGPADVTMCYRFGRSLLGNVAKHALNRSLDENSEVVVEEIIGKLKEHAEVRGPAILGALLSGVLNECEVIIEEGKKVVSGLKPNEETMKDFGQRLIDNSDPFS